MVWRDLFFFPNTRSILDVKNCKLLLFKKKSTTTKKKQKLFVAVHERHDNMKAWTDLLNNRTHR